MNLNKNITKEGIRLLLRSSSLINSNSSILKNHNQNFIPESISGVGNFSGSVFNLKARIKNKSAGVDLALKINPGLINPLSIKLKGHDISKDLIIFSLPNSLKGVSSYIDTNINLGRKNSIYFNYSIPINDLNADLKVKILIDGVYVVDWYDYTS